MHIPDFINWNILNEEMKMPTEDVKNIMLHHFAFIPQDMNLNTLSISEKRNVYYNREPDFQASYEGGNFQDYMVPYHYIIDKDPNGKFRYTKTLPTDACSGHDGFNDNSEFICNTISIAIAGDYRDSHFEPELEKTIEDLVTSLDVYYPIERVLGHRDVDNTICPSSTWSWIEDGIRKDSTFKTYLNTIVYDAKTNTDIPTIDVNINTIQNDDSNYIRKTYTELPDTLQPDADIYKQAGDDYNIPWQMISAIHCSETMNRNTGTCTRHTKNPTSYAGAKGCMQFMPGTWYGAYNNGYGVDANGDGVKDINNCVDSIFSAANYLSQNYHRTTGSLKNKRAKAFWHYNHAQWYVDGAEKVFQTLQ